MSFRMQIDPRSRKAARFISGVHKQLQQAYLRASARGITQQEIANTLDVDRSTINRRLMGGGNLTLRTLSDFAHAMDESVEVVFRPQSAHGSTANYRVGDEIVTTASASAAAIAAPAVGSTSNKSSVVTEYA